MHFKKLILIFLALISIQTVYKHPNLSISRIEIDTIYQDKINIRAISIEKNNIYYAADKNRVGVIDLISKTNKQKIVINDSLNVEFRSCAKTKNYFFALSIGKPALLYRFSNDLSKRTLVYEEYKEGVFYDSMQFYDDKNGIAVGDPINGRMSIITTKNGGVSWQKNNPKNSPVLNDGEAFFAASNTNISIKNGKTWVFSGGQKSRLFYSEDKGLSWKSSETPIIQGQKMTGIFSSDFYNDKIGIIAGGNYEIPNLNNHNKAITVNGGTSWNLLSDNDGFGYASCIRFFPGCKGQKMISVGLTGIYISNDFGLYWKKISNDRTLNTIAFKNKDTAIAAGKNKIIQIRFY